MAESSVSHRDVRNGAVMRTFNMSCIAPWARMVPRGTLRRRRVRSLLRRNGCSMRLAGFFFASVNMEIRRL